MRKIPRNPIHASIFDTALGACALAWSDKGLIRLALPSATPEQTKADVERLTPAPCRWSDAPPKITRMIRRLQNHLCGQLDPFQDEISLDFEVHQTQTRQIFTQKVYHQLRTILPGRTTTYSALANAVGNPHAARAVGNAMSNNPLPLLIPCHRVLTKKGIIGNFSAPGGSATKKALLLIEGIPIANLGGALG